METETYAGMDAECATVMAHYRVGCAEIRQLHDTLFELQVDNGTVLQRSDCLPIEHFWQQHCQRPFDLLINGDREFSFSFEAALCAGANPLQRHVAIFARADLSYELLSNAIEINALNFPAKPIRLFRRRADASRWLSQMARAN
ncbi:hypothetical protein [uncultured Ferrimonas sp.]|uniref:hypothetical protein n=1 Tax=uncultured Ferrimonas sp. TaxID=432640 RepID=UPI00262C1FD7|nr:hypothetical protein [uncultured Ferrimonas sp.]